MLASSSGPPWEMPLPSVPTPTMSVSRSPALDEPGPPARAPTPESRVGALLLRSWVESGLRSPPGRLLAARDACNWRGRLFCATPKSFFSANFFADSRSPPTLPRAADRVARVAPARFAPPALPDLPVAAAPLRAVVRRFVLLVVGFDADRLTDFAPALD